MFKLLFASSHCKTQKDVRRNNNKKKMILTQTAERWALKRCKFVSIAHRHISKKWFISSVKRALSSFMACLSLSPPFTSSSLSVCHLSCCQAFTSQTLERGHPALKLVQCLIYTPHTNIQHLSILLSFCQEYAGICLTLSLTLFLTLSLSFSLQSFAFEIELNTANLS